MQVPLALTPGSLRWRERVESRWDGGTDRRRAGRVSKVLQVTVQVKRQILSAVWRKALEVPTVQRDRSSLSGTRARVRARSEWPRLLCSIHEWTTRRKKKIQPSEPTHNQTGWGGFMGDGFCLHPWPVFSFHVQMAQLSIRDTSHDSDNNTVAKHVETLHRVSLFLGSSEWRQFVQLMSQNQASDMLSHLQDVIWRKDTCNSWFYSRTTTYSPPPPTSQDVSFFFSMSLQPC